MKLRDMGRQKQIIYANYVGLDLEDLLRTERILDEIDQKSDHKSSKN